MFQLKPKLNKFLHPTKGWLDEIEAIKYHTEIGKRYPYEISGWVMIFNQELKEAYEENIKQNAK